MKTHRAFVLCLALLGACGHTATRGATVRDVPHVTRFAALEDVVVPPARQLAEGDRIVGWIRSQTRTVSGRLDRARQLNDPRAVRCLDDQLAQLHALLRSAQGRYGQLLLAAANRDAEAGNREFHALAVIGNESDWVVTAGRRCRLVMPET